MFEGEHAVVGGGFFDEIGVDVSNVTTDEGLDVDELFHDDDTIIVAEWVFCGNDGVVECDVVEIDIFEMFL